MLEWPGRETDATDAVSDNEALAAAGSRLVKVQVSSLAILCMLTAALSFLFFPALAAIPLGIFALRRIEDSHGRLTGRHLAIAGLCIATAWLAFWLAAFAAFWIVLQLWQALWTTLGGMWNAIF